MPDKLDDDDVVSSGKAVDEPGTDTPLGRMLADGEVDWLVGGEPRSAPGRSSTLDTSSVLVDDC